MTEKVKKEKKAVKETKTAGSKKNGFLRRPFLMSIGALALAEEQASSLWDSFVEKSEEARKKGEKFIKQREKAADKGKQKIEKKQKPAEGLIERTLHLFNIPTLDEVEKLNKKVEALTKKVA